ncbi:hypothetical protein [Methylobacterium iners]|uniref:Uncharacterized protein n=1 Tax=Methylobacterium iners TaxID=418707 RepID=A0ABQ4S6Y1_9HYPH|nr:hypothetical protein [Methylobacterium iners]GJD97634.1 hypothetical protein OCOJLMKI_4867 [Methylobacterium iners]
MVEAIFGFLARLIWWVLIEWIGYWTGRAAITALSLGRLDVADFEHYNHKSFKPIYYYGMQRVVSSWAAIIFGQLLWFGAFVGFAVYLKLR